MKSAAVTLALALGTARADPPFCDRPCSPDPVTDRMLVVDEPVGKLVCKHGTTLGVDPQQRPVVCTTARPADVDGLPVAGDAYTLFHPNGRIYETTIRAVATFTLADRTKVACGAGLIALADDGRLMSCTLAKPRAGTPQARVGKDIGFTRSGRVARMTLATRYTAAGLELPVEADVQWDARGNLIAARASEPFTAGRFRVRFELALYPDGKLRAFTLAAPATLQGRRFAEFSKLELRPDGTLARAVFLRSLEDNIELTETYDRAGKVTSRRRTAPPDAE